MSDQEELDREGLRRVVNPIFSYERAQTSSSLATRFPERVEVPQDKDPRANRANNLDLKKKNDDLEKEVKELRQLPVEKGPDGEDLVSHLPKSGPLLESGPLTSAGAIAFYKHEMIRRGILENAKRYECSLRKMDYDDAKSFKEKAEIGLEGYERSKKVDTERIAGEEERRGTKTFSSKNVKKTMNFEKGEMANPKRR